MVYVCQVWADSCANTYIMHTTIEYPAYLYYSAQSTEYKLNTLNILVFASISIKSSLESVSNTWDSFGLSCCILQRENSMKIDLHQLNNLWYLLQLCHHILAGFYDIIDVIRLRFMMQKLKRYHIFIIPGRCSSWLK